MAYPTLIAWQSGSLKTAANWYMTNILGASSIIDSEAGAIGITTASTNYDSGASNYSSPITTVIGIGVKISALTSPAGDISFILRDSTAGSSLATVTLDASTLKLGWNVFTWSVITIPANHNWLIRITTSSGFTGNFSVYCSTGSITNMCRFVLTNVTSTPGNTDQMVIPILFGNISASPTITIDTNDASTYGANGNALYTMSITNGSTLQYAYAASNTYAFTYSGVFEVWGTFTMGTVANPIPSTSIAKLTFNGSSGNDGGISSKTGCTFTAYGTSPTYTRCMLNADAAQSATSLTTDVSTGWLNGNYVVVSGTNTNINQYKITTLSGDASGTSLTLASGIPAKADGNATCKAYIMVHNRNVQWLTIGTTSTNTLAGTITLHSVQIDTIGNAFNITGGGTIDYCSFQGTSTTGYVACASASALTIDHCNFYNTNSTAARGISIGGSVNLTITYNLIINTSFGYYISGSGLLQLDNNVVCNATYGIYLGVAAGLPTSNAMTGNTILDCTDGFYIASWPNNAVTNITMMASGTIQRCTYGIYVNLSVAPTIGLSSFNNLTISGCSTAGVRFIFLPTPLLFYNCTITSDTSYSGTYNCPTGVIAVPLMGLIFDTCTFSTTTNDINSADTNILLHNCTLSGAPALANSYTNRSSIVSLKEGGSAGTDKIYLMNGSYVLKDTTYFVYNSPAIRVYPNSTSYATHLRGFIAPISRTATPTVSIQVRLDAAYNGLAPKLYVMANPALGYQVDTLISTGSTSTGSFQTLSATLGSAATADCMVEYYLEITSNAGYMTVDDFMQSPVPTKANNLFGSMVGALTVGNQSCPSYYAY